MSKFYGLLVAIFFGSIISLFGVRPELERFIDNMYLQVKADEEMHADYLILLSQLEKEILEVDGDYLLDYLYLEMIMLEYYMGRVYQSFDSIDIIIAHNRTMRSGELLSLSESYTEREATLWHHERAFSLLEELEEIRTVDDKKFQAELLALEAEILNQLCLFKSLAFTLRYYPAIGRIAKKALKVDPKNVRGELLLLATKVYSPKVYGGNPTVALEALKEIDLSANIRREDLYNILLSFAYCYLREGQVSLAMKYLDKSLAIYPTNLFSLAMKQLGEAGEFTRP